VKNQNYDIYEQFTKEHLSYAALKIYKDDPSVKSITEIGQEKYTYNFKKFDKTLLDAYSNALFINEFIAHIIIQKENNIDTASSTPIHTKNTFDYEKDLILNIDTPEKLQIKTSPKESVTDGNIKQNIEKSNLEKIVKELLEFMYEESLF
jgi:hypothetical protein